MRRSSLNSAVGALAAAVAIGLASAGTSAAQIPVAPIDRTVVRLHNPVFAVGPRPDVVSGTEDAVATVTVGRGKKHRLILYFDLDAACRPTSPSAVVIRRPENGAITISSAKMAPFDHPLPWPSDDPRHKCDPSNTPAMALDYEPKPSFVGKDTAQVNIVDHGATSRFGFVISVE